MKYKNRVFSKALRTLEVDEYSCNALRNAFSNDPSIERMAVIEKYRAIFGYTEGNNRDERGHDAFLRSIEEELDPFGLRILLLSLAKVAWDDFEEGDL